tara:strand:+ start:305 stop:1720 length:1416 start_codon:yes stop_codon:yes gene_type:complete
VVEGAKPPINWSETENVKWKTKIPGSGLATPVIWKNQIFLVTAISKREATSPTPAQVNSDQPPAGGPGQRGPGGGGGFNREEILKRFDKDGDGQLNDGERKAMRASFGGSGRGQTERRARGGRPNRGGPRGGGHPTPQQEHEFNVMAIDRHSGELRWSRTASSQIPHEGHHVTNGFASASPVTNGEHLWVSFGSRGIYCYSLDGVKVWETDLGDIRSRGGFGEAVQPALAGNHLLITWDQEDQSYIVALDKGTGEEVWRKERDERTSWTTPVIVEVDGTQQAIIAGSNKTRAYNPENGDIIWEASGLTSNVIPTPVIGEGIVYVASGYQGRAVQAIKLSSKGDISGTDNIIWSAAHSAPYVASPVLSKNRLYMNKGNDAYFTCFNASTGEVLYQDESLEGIRGVYASPIAANGHIYIAGKEGTTVVIKDSDTFEIVSVNSLDDPIDASPVIVGDQMFIRSHTHLYCLSNES